MNLVNPNMFKPYVRLSRLAGAGMITVVGGHCSDMNYQIGSGQPWQSAYNDAFKLAVTAMLPLWYDDKLIYDPGESK